MIIRGSKITRLQNVTFEKHVARRSRTVVPWLLIFFGSFVASTSRAQNAKDTIDGRFHDDLLEHFAGKWNVSSIAHGKFFEQADLEATWVMNHQYLRIHLQGTAVVPRLGVPLEVLYFIGYNPNAKRYIVHELTAFGGDHPSGGFCYARRDGNQLKLVYKFPATADTVIVQRFIWKPDSVSWRMVSHMTISGNEQAPFLDLKIIPATLPTTKKDPSNKSGNR